MNLSPDLIAELEVLTLFDLATPDEGIKVHSSADPARIAAADRLFRKGIISLSDGGYLTSLGRRAVEQLRGALTILNTA